MISLYVRWLGLGWLGLGFEGGLAKTECPHEYHLRLKTHRYRFRMPPTRKPLKNRSKPCGYADFWLGRFWPFLPRSRTGGHGFKSWSQPFSRTFTVRIQVCSSYLERVSDQVSGQSDAYDRKYYILFFSVLLVFFSQKWVTEGSTLGVALFKTLTQLVPEGSQHSWRVPKWYGRYCTRFGSIRTQTRLCYR